MFYQVKWLIEIEADTPEDAARKALEIHRDPGSIATVFEVTGLEAVGLPTMVDLGGPDA